MHVRNIVNFRILYEARAVPYNKSPDVIEVVPAIFFSFLYLIVRDFYSAVHSHSPSGVSVICTELQTQAECGSTIPIGACVYNGDA